MRWPTGVVSNNRAYGAPVFDRGLYLGALLLPGSLAAPVVLCSNGGGVPGEIAPFPAGAQGAVVSDPEAVGFNPAGLPLAGDAPS